MEHFDGYVGKLIVAKRNRKFWNEIGSLDVSRYSPVLPVAGGFGFALSDELSINENLTNAHLEVVPFQNRYYFENLVHPTSRYQRSNFLKSYAFLGYFVERVVKKIAWHIQYGYFWFLGRQVFSIWVKGEEIAISASRIELDPGNPEIVIYKHKIGKESIDSLRRSLLRIKDIFASNDLGKIKFYKFVFKKNGFYLRPNWHPMGTLRISRDPSLGVVRPNFLFGDTKSVYIADASIFASGSNANPTFTALALASKMISDNF